MFRRQSRTLAPAAAFSLSIGDCRDHGMQHRQINDMSTSPQLLGSFQRTSKDGSCRFPALP